MTCCELKPASRRSRGLPALRRGLTLALGLITALPVLASGSSLRGSRASVSRQQRIASQHDFTYLRDRDHTLKFVRLGLLEKLPGNAHYEVKRSVKFPYARPEVKLFVERLARQYHHATGEKLVVTSLTRPLSHQPRNASENSVHPTGMAVDIRRSWNPRARAWLEENLKILEERGVIEATRERRPPHYHIAVYPKPYKQYVKARLRGESGVHHKVKAGESLWAIARQYGTSVQNLKTTNRIGNRIYPGQVLRVPTR